MFRRQKTTREFQVNIPWTRVVREERQFIWEKEKKICVLQKAFTDYLLRILDALEQQWETNEDLCCCWEKGSRCTRTQVNNLVLCPLCKTRCLEIDWLKINVCRTFLSLLRPVYTSRQSTLVRWLKAQMVKVMTHSVEDTATVWFPAARKFDDFLTSLKGCKETSSSNNPQIKSSSFSLSTY